MKKTKSSERRTLGLIASGVKTINIDQRMPRYHSLTSSGRAMEIDQGRLRDDGRRTWGKLFDREHA